MKKPNLVTAISFYDKGQDVLRFYIDSSGKILDCQPYHGAIYVGHYVLDHEKLKMGHHVMVLRNEAIRRLTFQVEHIHLLDEQESREVFGYYDQWKKYINKTARSA